MSPITGPGSVGKRQQMTGSAEEGAGTSVPRTTVAEEEEEDEFDSDDGTKKRKRIVSAAYMDDEKLKARREANRVHAFKSRQRSKLLQAELQRTVEQLSREKSEMERQNAVLRAQVEVLHQQNLSLMQSQQQLMAQRMVPMPASFQQQQQQVQMFQSQQSRATAPSDASKASSTSGRSPAATSQDSNMAAPSNGTDSAPVAPQGGASQAASPGVNDFAGAAWMSLPPGAAPGGMGMYNAALPPASLGALAGALMGMPFAGANNPMLAMLLGAGMSASAAPDAAAALAQLNPGMDNASSAAAAMSLSNLGGSRAQVPAPNQAPGALQQTRASTAPGGQDVQSAQQDKVPEQHQASTQAGGVSEG